MSAQRDMLEETGPRAHAETDMLEGSHVAGIGAGLDDAHHLGDAAGRANRVLAESEERRRRHEEFVERMRPQLETQGTDETE